MKLFQMRGYHSTHQSTHKLQRYHLIRDVIPTLGLRAFVFVSTQTAVQTISAFLSIRLHALSNSINSEQLCSKPTSGFRSCCFLSSPSPHRCPQSIYPITS
ncbi:hypothetical protein OUZ56_015074 [Daphnia magna]|uniref:Uncharacterized protein n=1 Tax=Daphnia magna TaxID=35525 RepID=A0ABR0ALQ8_9CRUS|nr:hypothetical protein OUZ56_015074 [Daphnia magna]